MATSARGTDWDIKGSAGTCAKCEKPFEDKEEFYARLRYTEEGYVREDYSLGCWEEELREGALSFWKGVFHAAPPKKEEPFKPENAETLLRELMEKNDPAHINTLFVLAVMLERKRILVEHDVKDREDGVKIRVYEHKQTGESFLIPDPELMLGQLEEVQIEVATQLGWTPPEKEEASDEAEGAGDAEEPAETPEN